MSTCENCQFLPSKRITTNQMGNTDWEMICRKSHAELTPKLIKIMSCVYFEQVQQPNQWGFYDNL